MHRHRQEQSPPPPTPPPRTHYHFPRPSPPEIFFGPSTHSTPRSSTSSTLSAQQKKNVDTSFLDEEMEEFSSQVDILLSAEETKKVSSDIQKHHNYLSPQVHRRQRQTSGHSLRSAPPDVFFRTTPPQSPHPSAPPNSPGFHTIDRKIKELNERINFLDPEMKTAGNRIEILETLSHGNAARIEQILLDLENAKMSNGGNSSSVSQLSHFETIRTLTRLQEDHHMHVKRNILIEEEEDITNKKHTRTTTFDHNDLCECAFSSSLKFGKSVRPGFAQHISAMHFFVSSQRSQNNPLKIVNCHILSSSNN